MYGLEEIVSATRGGRPTEITQYRIFVRTGDIFKIDWGASVGYNATTFARFRALQDGQTVIMRCYGNLGTSRFDNYFGFSIRDELANRQFIAYIRRDHPDAMSLMDFLEGRNARSLILEMRFTDEIDRYSLEKKNRHITFKVTDVFARLIKQTARFAAGKNVAEQSRTKALCADCGFA